MWFGWPGDKADTVTAPDGTAGEAQQQIGLVLQREVDGDTAVGQRLARWPRPLPRPAAPDPPLLVGGELGRQPAMRSPVTNSARSSQCTP